MATPDDRLAVVHDPGTARGRQVPGDLADRPGQIPKRGWVDIIKRATTELGRDNMTLVAAGVAFYAFLSIVPTLVAATLLYGLVTDPAQVQRQVKSLSGVMPKDAASLVGGQMTALASANHQGLGIGFVVSLLLALWSASGGVGNLMTAVNIAYDETETRGFVQRKAISLGLTIGAIVFFAVAFSLVALFPAVANALHVPGPVRLALEVVRWLVVLVVISVALAVIYTVAPDRDDPKIRWVSTGAAVATVGWLVVSIGFSLYVNFFGSYGKTYGSLAGVVVLLLWLWLSTLMVLIGAEVNAQSEQQTARDTTVGPQRPIGERDAVMADSLPGDNPPQPRR